MINLHSHFGVYALILDGDKHRVLVVKKARGPYTCMYDLPGGSPEPAELLEEALHREVTEETGCDVSEAKQIRAVDVRFPYTKDGESAVLRHIGVLFAVKITGTPRIDADGEDSLGCAWVKFDELRKENAAPFVLKALELVSPMRPYVEPETSSRRHP
ncbi:MAG TPA: NUDIX domain-containing protein [Candidatus Baltobacteraceae bacterium]|jgi:8-oxo-dGTP pyrophosphatase MutT (NUDIX family)|nr:NUDIX domain-containing protein [Candidatus Baltobacteraceae bacterium]